VKQAPHVVHVAGELGATRVTALVAWDDGAALHRELISVPASIVNTARYGGPRALFLSALGLELCRVGAHWPGCGCLHITVR
jgi:hypothetical protein